MQSNKFKGIIIYVVIIALLVFGLIAILNGLAPYYVGENKVMPWNKTYSELLDEYDKLNVRWFELDLR
ncbi:MAG: hypothetical protein J6X60_03125, partial [Ruminiclostridium sp.]|nr:hypothetical protein [Ruminiclostridium sp.]